MKNKWILLSVGLLLLACSNSTSENSPAPSTLDAVATSTATAPPSSTVPPPSATPTLPAILITSGDRSRPQVALTFDMCQDPRYPAGYDAAIVEVLQRYDVQATFFMGGDWMRTHPYETRILGSDPNFELGDHSWSHPDFTGLTEAEMDAQLSMTEDLLFHLTGKRSRLFRPPAGLHNDLVLQVAANHGMYTVEWDSVTGDPSPNFDADTILGEVQRTVRNGSIVIMHANGRGWHTAEALPSIIEYLELKGYDLVTVSQLLELNPSE